MSEFGLPRDGVSMEVPRLNLGDIPEQTIKYCAQGLGGPCEQRDPATPPSKLPDGYMCLASARNGWTQ